jgi:hypothetical protein
MSFCSGCRGDVSMTMSWREAHAVRGVHGVRHVVEEAADVVVHAVDGGGGLLQDRVGPDDDLAYHLSFSRLRGSK